MLLAMEKTNQFKFLIVIPCYNEGGSIAKLLGEINRFHNDIDILVVDDGSTDDSAQKVKAVEGVNLLSLPFNMGIGSCVQTGYIWAYENGYDFAVRLDGDGQHHPEDIQKHVDLLLSGECDFTIGSRYLDGKKKDGYFPSFVRRLGIHYISNLIFLMTGHRISDPTSGFIGCNRRVLEVFSNYFPHDYPEPEAILLVKKFGGQIMEIPVTMRSRQNGKSTIGTLASFYYFIKMTLALIAF
jgi:glycosyltransferase involved in cell wall biosynthesis